MNANTKPYWRQFRRNLVSPKFHWLFLKNRLKANLIDAPFYRRLMSVIFILAVAATVTVTNSWVTFLVVWVFPLTFLYHISALCHLSSEHLWAATGSIESKSHARFCGEPFPFEGSLKERLAWFLRMLFYHLPVRIAVFADPENSLHNIHHNDPKVDRDWTNLTYNSQKQVDEEGAEYREYWGLHNAIEAVFQSLANTPHLSEEEIQRLLNHK
jgi:hypothetical protein